MSSSFTSVVNTLIAAAYLLLSVLSNLFLLRREKKLFRAQEPENSGELTPTRTRHGAGLVMTTSPSAASKRNQYSKNSYLQDGVNLSDLSLLGNRDVAPAAHDSVCWYYMCICFFALGRAVIVFGEVLLVSKKVLSLAGSRRTQDLMVTPVTQIYMIVSVMLIYLFTGKLQIDEVRAATGHRLLFGAILLIVLYTVTGEVLLSSEVIESRTLEYATNAEQFILALILLITAVVAPPRLRRLGKDMNSMAQRVLIVSLLQALFLTTRAIVLLPTMQDNVANSLGAYSNVLLWLLDFIPLCIILRVLKSS